MDPESPRGHPRTYCLIARSSRRDVLMCTRTSTLVTNEQCEQLTGNSRQEGAWSRTPKSRPKDRSMIS
jgi:hypothetical protein